MTKLPGNIRRALQARAARVSLGPSSMRGRGNRGVVDKGRKYLSNLKLNRFGTQNGARFRHELDRATDELMRSFPRSARHWGLARKGLNIFLRECLYTVYLRDHYHLGRASRHFEIPLDSLTGRELWEASKRELPRWKTVKGLRPEVSDRFQAMARRMARQRGIDRVHLDALWWGQRTTGA